MATRMMSCSWSTERRHVSDAADDGGGNGDGDGGVGDGDGDGGDDEDSNADDDEGEVEFGGVIASCELSAVGIFVGNGCTHASVGDGVVAAPGGSRRTERMSLRW